VTDGGARTPAEREAERTERRRRNARQRRAWRASRRARTAREPRGPAHTEPVAKGGRGRPRVRQGVVVSDKAPKTLVVRIDTTRQHRVYKKTVRESTTLHAHDERDEARAGDTVRVVESRPLSATKRWRLTEILERAR
jgi:small subunit ribosomal protein S17